jgi:hypothetical protein
MVGKGLPTTVAKTLPNGRQGIAKLPNYLMVYLAMNPNVSEPYKAYYIYKTTYNGLENCFSKRVASCYRNI